MTKKLRLITLTVAILIFTIISSVNAGPTHGWFQKPIRLDYCAGGPNIKINQTTGLTISRVSSREYKAFGYFTYNPTTRAIIETHEVTFDNDGKAYIGQFEEGTRVGTWLTTENGTFHSVASLNEAHEYRATYLGDTPEGNLKVGLEGDRKWCGADYREMVVAFEPTEHAPAGQPLPGIIISVLIGLGITGIARSKKHKKSL